MKPIDTHSHLYMPAFEADRAAVHTRAREALAAVCLPNVDLESIPRMLRLAASAPDFYFPMIGLHPCSVHEDWEETLARIKSYLDDPDLTWYGIGETGLDLYWDKSTLPWQEAALRVQAQWAQAAGLPLILHARDAIDQTTALIADENSDTLRGIFHCFDGTPAQAARILELGGFKLGIGGIVTYRADVQAMVREVPLSGLVLETDSPYLPPEPHRKAKNRRNESSYTTLVCEAIARIKGLAPEEVAAVTSHNAKAVFTRMSALTG